MLDRESSRPLYAQLEDILRTAITNKEWEPNRQIPSELELSRQYNLSRVTVRSVITRLVNDGLLYRVQGKGTYVAEPKIPTQSLAFMGVREQLEKLGYETSTQVICFEKIYADYHLSHHLNIPTGELVQYIERVRFVNGTPLSIHHSYIPKKFFTRIQEEMLETEQLCVLLEENQGLKPASISETLSAVLATEEEAELLLLEPRAALLLIEDENRTADGVIFEFSKVLFRADKISLNFKYRKDQLSGATTIITAE